MKRAFIGTYFRKESLDKAIECMNRKNLITRRIYDKDLYKIVEFPNGYLVISQEQLK